MDTMLARYLDGDLTEHEARAFQTLLEANRALAAELREIEGTLDLFTGARCRRSTHAFVARVMEALPPAVGGAARTRRATWRAWALAATIVLSLGLGWAAGRYAPGVGAPGSAGDLAAAGPAGADLRWVRLVHVPADPAVTAVSVAGDFNGWNARATPMARQGGAWVTWLALPADVYEYMFVEDAAGDREHWVTDPLAVQTRADGFGGENAVLDLGL